MKVASIKRQDWPEHHPPMFSLLAVSIVLNCLMALSLRKTDIKLGVSLNQDVHL
jgi:hypothetical protein